MHAPFPFYCPRVPPHLHSFPTRRSSDLRAKPVGNRATQVIARCSCHPRPCTRYDPSGVRVGTRCWPCSGRTTRIRCWKDRKSTRLNSSHLGISYAVFCLKKKKKETNNI